MPSFVADFRTAPRVTRPMVCARIAKALVRCPPRPRAGLCYFAKGDRLRILFTFFISCLASVALGQGAQECKKAVSDEHYRPPSEMAVGQERAYGSRLVSPLFSAVGIDFYALGRLRYPSGEFVDDDGAWIVAVITNEGVRQAEVQRAGK